MLFYLSKRVGRGLASFPGSPKVRAEEKKRRAWLSAAYACASFAQILGKPYSVRASSVSKTSSCAKSAVE